ncbi:MAG: hypothetical protein WD232_07615, partial [Acidimicrobiales bacterium]
HTGGGTVHRAASFAELVGGVSPSERILLLRGRLSRLLVLPAQARDAALAELAYASGSLPEDAALGYMTAELIVLMELPKEGLEAALAIRVATHQRLDPERMLVADRALDAAVGDALGLTQRLLVREHLASLGFERP